MSTFYMGRTCYVKLCCTPFILIAQHSCDVIIVSLQVYPKHDPLISEFPNFRPASPWVLVLMYKFWHIIVIFLISFIFAVSKHKNLHSISRTPAVYDKTSVRRNKTGTIPLTLSWKWKYSWKLVLFFELWKRWCIR